MKAVEAYRQAAMEKFRITREEAERSIVEPADDTGEWAPKSKAVIYLEHGMGLEYWDSRFLDLCCELEALAAKIAKGPVGYVECINAAVCAVYE